MGRILITIVLLIGINLVYMENFFFSDKLQEIIDYSDSDSFKINIKSSDSDSDSEDDIYENKCIIV